MPNIKLSPWWSVFDRREVALIDLSVLHDTRPRVYSMVAVSSLLPVNERVAINPPTHAHDYALALALAVALAAPTLTKRSSSWARGVADSYENSAFYGEADTFDLCGGHATVEGWYHHHSVPGCLQEQAVYASGISEQQHSPQLGWAHVSKKGVGATWVGGHGEERGQFWSICCLRRWLI